VIGKRRSPCSISTLTFTVSLLSHFNYQFCSSIIPRNSVSNALKAGNRRSGEMSSIKSAIRGRFGLMAFLLRPRKPLAATVRSCRTALGSAISSRSRIVGNGSGVRPLGLPAARRIALSSIRSHVSVIRTGITQTAGGITTSDISLNARVISLTRLDLELLSASRCMNSSWHGDRLRPTLIRFLSVRGG
jgi:hypothetical protein